MIPPVSLFDRPPPNDPESERGLLAAILKDSSQLDQVRGIVSGHDFHDPEFGRMFVALGLLHEAREPIGDLLFVVPALHRMNLSERVTNAVFIGELIGVGIASNAPFYASQIRKLSLLRSWLDTGAEIIRRVHQHDAAPDQISQWIDARRDTLAETNARGIRSFREVAAEVLNDLDSPQESGGTMTGVDSIDNVLGAMLPGEVTILAARTGIGKTSLATQIATHCAKSARPVLYVSLEMRDRELVQRQLCSWSGVNSMRVRTRVLDGGEKRRMVEAAGDLGDLPLDLWSPASATFGRIRAAAKMHHAKRALRLAVVDYVGLVAREDWKIQEHEHISRVSAGLKQLAKELPAPILCLAQLNREADKDEAPRLSQLAKSGAIEQDADVVMMLHRPKGNSDTQCIIAKNRHGATGKFTLEFDARRTMFKTVEPKRHQAFDDYNEGL